MNSIQELTARLQAKQIVQDAINARRPQIQKVTRILANENPKDLFESKLTISLDQKTPLYEPANFVYYKLNLDYLKWLGIDLQYIDGKLVVSKDFPGIMYGEYFLDTKHSCIIFIKYSFNHVELHSENNKTNLKTNVFVNSKCEVFYYDDYSGARLLNSFQTNLNVSSANELFAQKTFKIESMPSGRTYKISSSNSDTFEEHDFEDIHLICIRLMNILFENCGQRNMPSHSELKIETKFLGMTEKPVIVQTKVHICYQNNGIIELSEKLEQYEMTLYFSCFPDKKVQAKFEVTSAEKNGFINFTEDHLKNAILVSPQKSFNDDKSLFKECSYIFYEHFVSLCKPYERDEKSALNNIGKFVSQYVTLGSTSLNPPDLKDTFQKLYVEHFKINVADFPKENEFTQLKLSFEYSENQFYQVGYYSIKYNGIYFLVKIILNYYNHYYYDSDLIIYLPAFTAYCNSISVFKPTSQEDVDRFLDNRIEHTSTWKIATYENYDLRSKRKIFTEIFPDFAIESAANKSVPAFTIHNKYNNELLKNIFESIQNPGTATTTFHFTAPFAWGSDDEGIEVVKYPIYTGNVVYGFNIQEKSYLKCINSSFQNYKPGEYSTGDNLLTLEFRSQTPSYKTSLHSLLETYHSFRNRDYGLKFEKYVINKSELWKFCAKFLVENQNEIFSD